MRTKSSRKQQTRRGAQVKPRSKSPIVKRRAAGLAPGKPTFALTKDVSPSFEDLVRLQARLLGPGGCPWDREQTHETLRTYLVEETYERSEERRVGKECRL